MKQTGPLSLIPRRSRDAQRGSLTVAAMVIILGMMVMVGGIHFFMQEQMRQSYEIQKISFARLQTLYLAEMGVNQIMYEANKAANASRPDPFPVASGAAIALNFKGNVALVRSDASGAADCIVTRTGTDAFRVDATLVSTDTGTFNRTVNFTVGKPGGQWVLTSYRIQ